TRGRRTASPRHRTLAAAFDWRHSRLSQYERRMLSHLAALGGPFTAAQAIASYTDGACERPSDALYGLYEKSLLTVDASIEEPMFRVLDTTRAYLATVSNS